MGADPPPALRLLGLHGLQGGHGVGELPAQQLLDEEEHQRNHDDDHAHGGCKAVVCAHLAHELGIKHDREGLVALADDHRRTKIGEDPHEHQQHTGQQRGQDQRENNLGHPLEGVAAQALRRFVQRVVQVLHGAGHVHIDQRERLEREHQHDTGKAIDTVELHMEERI